VLARVGKRRQLVFSDSETIATPPVLTGQWCSFEVARDEPIDGVCEAIVAQRYVSMEKIDVTVAPLIAEPATSEEMSRRARRSNQRRRAQWPVAN
jgi:hypothetical protein